MKRKSKKTLDLTTKRRAHHQQEIDNDSWLQLHRSSLRSLAKADYDAAIDRSRQALDQLERLKSTVLDTSAEAYAMKGQFRKAVEAAKGMIDCAPTAAVGYLRYGHTLGMQGRHEHAIQVYDQGIEKVPIDSEQYASLQDQKAASHAQLDKRVDFLTRLPLDIVQVIIEKLDIVEDKMLACLNVSTHWRQTIIDCPVAWRNIPSIHYALFRFLPAIGQHIKSLNISWLYSDETQMIIKAVIDGVFCNIHHLTVEEECDSIGRDQLLVILTRLSSSLSQLTLKVETNGCALPLESILLACPKLEELCYHVDHGDMCFSEAISTPVMTECDIKSLELKANLITSDTLDAILQRCPHLRNIHVSSCTADSLKLISDLCPRIKTIGFNGPAPLEPWIHSDDRPGLRQFKLYPVEHLEAERVVQILESSQSTLQMLMISLFDERPNVLQRWNGLANIKADNLTNLNYAYGNSTDMHKAVAAMIRNCKALQSVAFQSLTNVSDDNKLEEALATLPDLKSFVLYDINKVNVAGLTLLFMALAHIERNVSLRNVSFKKCSRISNNVLKALAGIKAVERIDIADCKDLSADVLKTFIIELSSQKTLKELLLEKMDIVTDVTLCDIARLSNLKRLTLYGLSNVSDTGVKYLAFQLRRLEWFHVFNCPQVDWLTMTFIRKEIRARREA
ncbi:hypothetical protein BJV82DRAFT_615974 [Fennellomyces sp. T-0311]|nr:hypothetical protein BJV82DRAFT_615974 [Fennellomyces sp. T-0311]